jgi:hypothetical protein
MILKKASKKKNLYKYNISLNKKKKYRNNIFFYHFYIKFSMKYMINLKKKLLSSQKKYCINFKKEFFC